MVPYFQKSERWTAPADNHNITGQFDPSIHGFKGEVGVSLLGFPTPIDQKAIDAANELGGKYAFNLDTNSGNQLGIGVLLFQRFTYCVLMIMQGTFRTRSRAQRGVVPPQLTSLRRF